MIRSAFTGAFLFLAALLIPAPAPAYTQATLHQFCSLKGCRDGDQPMFGLVSDSAGNLYGVTGARTWKTNGGGTVFELVRNSSGWDMQILHTFKARDPRGIDSPDGGLIIDTSGNLYGVTMRSLYELIPNADRTDWKFKTLYRFCPENDCQTGIYAVGRLAYLGASSGLLYDGISPLYGATYVGGNHFNGGVVYQLMPNGRKWDLSVIYSFCTDESCPDGRQPFAGLLVASEGTIYGTTNNGGNANCLNGCGTVFRLTSQPGGKKHQDVSRTESVLYAFCPQAGCTDGETPEAQLAIDGTGDLIGTTYFGGANGRGTVFKVTMAGRKPKETVLHDFCDCGDGGYPEAGVTLDPGGAIFGVSSQGGGSNAGAAWRLSGSHFTTLYGFCSKQSCEDGTTPLGELLLDSAGNLFGTALRGGNKHSAGTVFQLTP